MAAFCWFYHFTPDQYDELTLEQYVALKTFLIDYHKPPKQKKGR